MPPQQPPRPPVPPKRYKDGHIYLPPQIERAMARQQHGMPDGRQKYSGDQRQPVTQAGIDRPLAAEPAAGQVVGPQAQPAQAPNGPPASPYEFMLNPEKPARKFSLPGSGAPLRMRILYISGALLGLIVVFLILKGLFSGTSDLAPFTAIVQDQQELLHLSSSVTEQQVSVSTANLNFAATTQLSVNSSQTALLKYLAASGQKLNVKVLNLRVSASLDSQLQAAIAATTYDQTLQEIMKNQLTAYMNDLQYAYNHTTGKNGHALLSSDYAQAKLLLKQLDEPGQ